MTKLSILRAAACVAGAIFAVTACGGDDSDNPSTPGTGGAGGSATGGTGGSTGGTGGATSGGTGGTSEAGSGGTTSEAGSAGVGGGDPGPSCPDVYADRPNGRKDVPTDADGNVTADVTLTSDTIWTLNGKVWVQPGKTITIEPCTLIEATPKPNAGSLFIMRGAKIKADGTPNAPIVFTSQNHKWDTVAPWGGVILLGAGPQADGATEKFFEGLTDERAKFGGTVADDDSGSMSYVRIEYGGDIIISDKEINGLTFCGVGNKTKIHHIMAKDTADDCFEWFGGTVSADHLICQNAGDDMFDLDEGYRGKLQYLFGRVKTLGSSANPYGLEWDGNKPKPAATGRSIPVASNITVCGLNDGAKDGASAGVVLRNGIEAGSTVFNSIVTGFKVGMDTRDDVGTQEAPKVTWKNGLFFENNISNIAPDPEAPDNDGSFNELTWIKLTANANGETKPAGFDCWADPPVPPTAAVAGGPVPEGLDAAGNFVGAVKDAASNWMTGAWVKWTTERSE